MLKECWDWLRASADVPQRRLGYVGEAVAISARYGRCREAWQQHLTSTQQFIREAITTCRQRRQVVVLGAGACFDVPLAELNNAFEHVVLIDAVQLTETQRLLQRFDRCEYRVHDITEINSALLTSNTNAALSLLTSKTPKYLTEDSTVDLVISVNLLSQLPLQPMRWLKQCQQFGDSDINQFGLDLMRAHCRYLQQFSSHKVLIYDAEQWSQSVSGEQCDHVRLDEWVNNEWALLPMLKKAEWEWQLAPQGESGHTSTIHRVQALLFAS